MSGKSDGANSAAATPATLSRVERWALRASKFEAIYPPTEKIPAIVVEHFPALGRLTALRFLEWVQATPEGVVSLPTGKTPEHFIGWTQRLLQMWDAPETRRLLEEAGLDPARKPDMKGLRFVQIDEFYPMSAAQENSFHHFVRRFYLDGFGMDPAKALLIDGGTFALRQGERLEDLWPDGVVDLSLRSRQARTLLEQRQKEALEDVDRWCMAY
jgi:glucosamine-6-phosphate deaminase